jgi:hypothetical protein
MKNTITLFLAVALLVSCKDVNHQQSVSDYVQTATKDSLNKIAVKQYIIDSMKTVNQIEMNQRLVNDQQILRKKRPFLANNVSIKQKKGVELQKE